MGQPNGLFPGQMHIIALMKSGLSILTAIALVLLLYVGSYFWAVRPIKVAWYPSKHVPVYRWGKKSKPFFAPLVWLDTSVRPEYWLEDLDANPSW
jgi:hypothetical protein